MADNNRDRSPTGDVQDAPVLYDDENDILYVTLSETKVVKTVALDDLRLVDYDAAGEPAGIEFIGASEGLDLSDVPSAALIQALLTKAGIDFAVVA